MRAEEFVEKIYKTMPSIEELEDYGLDEQEIEMIQATCQARFRYRGEPIGENFAGEIGRLIWYFDCSTIDIGRIRFDSKLTNHPGGLRFGLYEADPLLIGVNGAVLMYDHSNLEHELSHCASSSEKFLDALALFAQFIQEKDKWRGQSEEAADQCTKVSGEMKSKQFYQHLCEFLDT